MCQFKNLAQLLKSMDLSKEFSGVQASAEVKMKRYADERMDKLIDVLSRDNPSLIKTDMLKSMARSEIAYGCCHYDTSKHKRCKNVATLRGYCETHVQTDPSTGGTYIIPIEKSLLFRTSSQKNNPEGRSILRNAYRPWYFKRRIEEIEAIGIERDLAGLPVAYLPPEYLSSTASPEQVSVLNAIKEIVTSIKRNEQEGIVMPAMYDDAGHKMFDLQLLSSGGARQFDTDKVIQRYDQRMSMSILADFILLGSDRVGSYALGTSKMDLWSMSVDSIAKNIAEVINQYAIPRLMKLNGMDVSRAPYLTYGEVSHVDLTEMSDFVTKLAQAGVLMPDPKLEDYLRELAGLPPAEHDGQSFGMPPMPEQGATEPGEMESPEEEMEEEELEVAEGTKPLDGDLD